MRKRNNCANEEIAELMERWDIEYTWVDKLLHPFLWLWGYIQEKGNNLRYHCQRFRKGYSNRDVWEMRDWFIRTAKPMLRELRVKAYNYPEEVGEDRWRELLLEMADLLEVMDLWDDGAARKAAGISENDRSEESRRRIGAGKEKAKERFFFLFDKYFYDLWY